MGRQRKKATLNSAEIISADEVFQLWNEAGFQGGEQPSPLRILELQRLLNDYRAQPFNLEQEKFMTEVRRAHKLLLAWCNANWYEEDGHMWRGQHIDQLEKSLNLASPQINSPSLRLMKKPEWVLSSIIIWNVARGILEEIGQRAGKSSNSKAIKFTHLALTRMGYAHATPNAVAITIKNATKPSPT